MEEEIVAAQLAAGASVLSSFKGQISGMQSFVEEGSAIGKAFYVAQQAMAAGMAIIKGYEAAGGGISAPATAPTPMPTMADTVAWPTAEQEVAKSKAPAWARK